MNENAKVRLMFAIAAGLCAMIVAGKVWGADPKPYVPQYAPRPPTQPRPYLPSLEPRQGSEVPPMRLQPGYMVPQSPPVQWNQPERPNLNPWDEDE